MAREPKIEAAAFFISASCVVLIAGTTSCATPNLVEPQTVTVETLRADTREDIRDAYRILSTHHPGMYNPFDPDFPEMLRQARDDAFIATARIETAADRLLAVQEINKALADGHARVQVAFNGSLGNWPGFDARWRGDGLYVVSSTRAAPLRGSKLISCDGRSATELIEEEAFRTNGRPKEAGQWWQSAGNFFRRGDLSVQPAPQNCRFESPGGEVRAVRLVWEPYPLDEFMKLLSTAQPEPIGMAEHEGGLQWITLSSFAPDPDGMAAYEELLAQLDAMGPRLTAANAIVLDLRGNKGGSSSWSEKIAQRLWGEDAVAWARAQYFRETEVWYLADEANMSHFGGLVPDLKKRGLTDIADWADEKYKSMQAASAKGQRFYKEPYGQDLFDRSRPAEPRKLPPVYVITHGGCASACLDAVDLFTMFDNVKLIGAPTSADTNYLEIRRQQLPSGRGSVILPTKIWVNRPRSPGEVYHPDILVTDLDWTTETFRGHILRDLARRQDES